MVMATTDGLTKATTSAMLGSAMGWFPELVVSGGVQVGLIGVGGGVGAGAGAGLGGGAGEISIRGTAQPILSMRERIRMREITKYFRFIFCMADFIVARGAQSGQK